MSKLERLHPDYLADRARRGGLDPEGRRALGAHLAACSACAWEHTLIDDFERARAQTDADAAALDRLLDGALARAGLATAPIAPPRRAAARRTALVARCIAAAAFVAAAVAVAIAFPTRTAADPSPSLAAPTEAGLDAGALGPAIGGDS